MLGRLLASAALALCSVPLRAQSSAPVAAQAGEDRPLASLGEWVSAFASATSEPNVVAAGCTPQLNAAMGSIRDASSARAALEVVRPCGERIRAAYARSAVTLDRLQPLPPEVEGPTGFDSRRFLSDQRRLAAASVGHMDTLERFLRAMADGDRAALPVLFAKVRHGGAALIDGNVMQMRLQRSTTRLAAGRGVIDVRIAMADAVRAIATAAPSPAGFAVGDSLSGAAKRAGAAVRAVREGWRTDRAAVAAQAEKDARLSQVLVAGDRMIAEVTARGTAVAGLLTEAGRTPVLSQAMAVRLAGDLNGAELALSQATQAFAATLQKIE